MGRPAKNGRAMTNAERQSAFRARCRPKSRPQEFRFKLFGLVSSWMHHLPLKDIRFYLDELGTSIFLDEHLRSKGEPEEYVARFLAGEWPEYLSDPPQDPSTPPSADT